MKWSIGILIIAIFLFSFGCATTVSGDTAAVSQSSPQPNITREKAIQIIENISANTRGTEVNSYPDMDMVEDGVRYYYIQATLANKMTATYFVDENMGNVFAAIKGELDPENPIYISKASDTSAESALPVDQEANPITVISEPGHGELDRLIEAIGMSANQAIQTFGANYKKIKIDYGESRDSFLYSELGFYLAFDEDDKVASVYCTDQIDINGAKAGMDFSQIQEILGITSLIQTWANTPTNTIYELQYAYKDATIVFFSYENDGIGSILCIR